LQAYLSQNVAVPGIPAPVTIASINKSPASRFAENTNVNGAGQTVDVLYRLSKGHGGVMCEGCHNSTHAIWPVKNIFANDNIASQQLQGHHGVLTECSTCHTPFNIDDFKGQFDSNGRMKGPHGMHPVASAMWNKDHKEVFADHVTPANTCQSCHGGDGLGTALSRTAAQRTLQCKNEDGTLCGGGQQYINVAAGTPIGCVECHSNQINN